MPPSNDESSPSEAPSRPKRERSVRYPGVGLAESLKLCESIDGLGLDGLTAADIASALGYTNIKTNTFSARLSAARQFGLLNLSGNGYALTPLAREILHPVDPAGLDRLHRQALLKPPLYAELAERLAGKRVPEADILGNVLYHNHQIIASAKRQAAEAFLESARFAGALGADQVFRPEGPPAPAPEPAPGPPTPPKAPAPSGPRPRGSEVRLDLRLWDRDEGKTIRLRAPQSITPASFERFLQAFRLLVRVEDRAQPGEEPDSGR
jgi:hypothetical protein